MPGPLAPEPAAPEAEPAVPEAAAEGEAPAPPEPAAAPSGDGEPGAGAGQAGPDVVTRTMGELYARQGHYDQAIRVFER
ncbi:MAG: hypothetical protein GWM92_19010, partial [Gemmatimonadetes bacterium]|nr:tetratricopeptide repeat-containing protein [Gemmatimonadota bacterium]NIU33496.1 tetratricopeptide repeat-containing protein [Gemmatimonadota bacterium]NIU37775.1 hypothetical protein [Gemmatimonadota bacterium]NIV84708.1 hypothetical protein [Gemmatimonadota bacterium]NIW66568.1 hypothetical protein [Gemmatimonadota bacterium]